MSRPWMPLYVGDYLADTAHLRAAEHGAYLLLIMHYWRTGALPDDDITLARIARMTTAEWRRARAVVQALFSDGWKHKRIEFELTEAQRLSNAGRTGGLASGNARRTKSEQPANDRSTTDERSFNDQGNDPPTIGEALQSQPQSQKKEPSLRSGSSHSGKRGSSIPEDWQPTSEDYACGAKLGLKLCEIEQMADEMRAWGKANANRAIARKADWSATFQGWMRRDAGKRRLQNSSAPRPGSKEDRQERTANAIQKLAEFVDAATNDTRAGSSPGPQIVGLLPLAKSA